jgi:ubiquinone/menaquinone biosynthesis C-methylase UbiE
MLTVDFDRLGVGAGTKVIDVGCGAGRHSFEAYRRGADVVAFDLNAADLNDVDEILQAMKDQGEVPESARAEAVKGDALDLPSIVSSHRRSSSMSPRTTGRSLSWFGC